MIDIVKEYTGMDFGAVSSDEEAVKMAVEHKVNLDKVENLGATLSTRASISSARKS